MLFELIVHSVKSKHWLITVLQNHLLKIMEKFVSLWGKISW